MLNTVYASAHMIEKKLRGLILATSFVSNHENARFAPLEGEEAHGGGARIWSITKAGEIWWRP